jgi:hypothetical protein
MTTVCPSGPRIRSPMIRAAVSVEPPGGNGTISVTGRVGNVCACAHVKPAHSASATAKLLISPPPLECTLGAPPMLIDFFLKLKSHKLPVSIKEYLTLLEAELRQVRPRMPVGGKPCE